MITSVCTDDCFAALPIGSFNGLQAAGVFIKGFAPSLDILQQYRVCLAPLRFGAGLKGKILDSWLHGLPVCTTPIGAEGMFAGITGNEGFPETTVSCPVCLCIHVTLATSQNNHPSCPLLDCSSASTESCPWDVQCGQYCSALFHKHAKNVAKVSRCR